MNAGKTDRFWKRLIERLYSAEDTDRNWATHVLATKCPPDRKSNLEAALEYCDRAELIAHLEQLAQNEPDSTTVAYAEEILRVLNSQRI